MLFSLSLLNFTPFKNNSNSLSLRLILSFSSKNYSIVIILSSNSFSLFFISSIFTVFCISNSPTLILLNSFIKPIVSKYSATFSQTVLIYVPFEQDTSNTTSASSLLYSIN